MTNGNYIKHFKVLGKLCHLHDTASSSATAQQTLRATTLDQAATGSSADLPASDLISNYQRAWSTAIANGASALQALALTIASEYMRNAYFTDDLTTEPASNSISAVIAALETEMGAGVDNVTLKTEGSTGLVNFFDTLKGSEGTWNTNGSPTYDDATYVVSTIV